MDPININSLFGDLLPPSASDLRAQGVLEANASQLPGGMAAMLAPMRGNNMRLAASGLFGVDTSTAKERLQTALGQLDLQSPTDAAKAVELIRPFNPAAAGSLQNMLIEQQRQLQATNADTTRSQAAMLNAQTAQATLPIEQQRADTQQFLSELQREELDLKNKTQEDTTAWRSSQIDQQIRENEFREEENKIQARLAELSGQELGSRDRAAVREATQAGRDLREKAASALSIAQRFTSLENIPSGAPAIIQERWKSLIGNEDEVTSLRANYNAVKNALVMDSLPPGVASDKDIELALSGFLPATANPEEVASFMLGMSKLSDISAKKEFMRAEHLVENKGMDSKFQAEWESYLETPEFKDYLQQRGHSLDSEKSTSKLSSEAKSTTLADEIAAEKARRAASATPVAGRI